MNFLAHLWLAGNDENLMLGAMLGDFVRGRNVLLSYPDAVRRGIELHRFIDQSVDSLPDVANLRKCFRAPFRRYSGIIIDLAFDHELAKHWNSYSDEPLKDFDRRVRDLLARHDEMVPDGLRRFMRYADRRGLFAAYRYRSEILLSLEGVGTRLSRPNPLHRVDEIWDDLEPRFAATSDNVIWQVRHAVAEWLEKN
jgi:acyl carrier protein phosphodiesterase